MKKLLSLALACALVLALAGAALATNGYQMTGIGALETAMGGAVTAAPQDAMTAITNPAGMARVGKRADFSMTALMPKRSVDYAGMGGKETEGGAPLYGIPSLGWTAPALDRDDTYFGGGMYVTSGLGVDYPQITMMPAGALDPAQPEMTFNGFSAIQFWKIAPTVAWNVNEKLTLGFALNMDYQSVAIVEKIKNVPDSMLPGGYSFSYDVNFDLGRPTSQMGVGATIGALYDVTDSVTLGFMYSTQQMFSEAEYQLATGDISMYAGATGAPGLYKMDLQYPQQAALGVAVTPDEAKKLLLTADVKWINWSSTHDKVKLSGPANSFMMGTASSTELNFGWDDQWVYALGARYKATENLALRAGFNYAKSPIGAEDVFNNLVFPAVVETHLMFGAEYAMGDHWSLAGTYEKGFSKSLKGANDIPAGMIQGASSSNAKISLETNAVAMQVSYKF